VDEEENEELEEEVVDGTSNIGKPDYASTVMGNLSAPTSSSVKRSRRFSGFDYYRRKLFLGWIVQSSSGMTQGGRGELSLR